MIKKILSLLRHGGFQRYLANTFWPLLEKGLRMLFGLSIGIWVAKYLGPTDFGTFSYVESIVDLFTILATVGLTEVTAREIVKNDLNRDLVLGSAFVVKLWGLLFSFLLLLLVIFLSGNEWDTNIFILIASLAIPMKMTDIIDSYFRGKVLYKYSALSNIIGLVFICSFRVFLILSHSPLFYFILTIMLEALVVAIFLIFFYIKENHSPLTWRFNYGWVVQLLRDSWPLLLGTISMGIYMRIDQIMIKELLGDYSVGIYAAAVKISSSCFLIAWIVSSSLLPAIVNAKKTNREKYLFRLQKMYDLMLLFFLFLSLLMGIFSKDIVSLLYGEQFSGSAEILHIHIYAGIFISAITVRRLWSLSENLQRYDFLLQFIGAITNIIFNFIFIDLYGIVGAAYATLLAHFLTIFVAGSIIKPMRPSLSMILKSYGNILSFKFFKKEYYEL